MKFIATAMLGGLIVLTGPAMAQDKDMSGMHDKGMAGMHDNSDASMQHRMSHRMRYKRNYKSDREEEQQTQALNRQYRGVSSDMH
jgi:hypothetical protein